MTSRAQIPYFYFDGIPIIYVNSNCLSQFVENAEKFATHEKKSELYIYNGVAIQIEDAESEFSLCGVFSSELWKI